MFNRFAYNFMALPAAWLLLRLQVLAIVSDLNFFTPFAFRRTSSVNTELDLDLVCFLFMSAMILIHPVALDPQMIAPVASATIHKIPISLPLSVRHFDNIGITPTSKSVHTSWIKDNLYHIDLLIIDTS